MKHIKLKDLLKETEMPHFPVEKNYGNHGADYVSGLLQDLSPEQKMDNAEIFNVLDQWFKAVKSEGGNMNGAIKDAMAALEWNDLDKGLVSDYLDNEAVAMDNPNDSDQY